MKAYRHISISLATLAYCIAAAQVSAQSPWESSSQKLATAFTGPIAKGLSLVAIVVGGLTFAYGEGGGKKLIGGIVFGVGMAMGAASFLGWLF